MPQETNKLHCINISLFKQESHRAYSIGVGKVVIHFNEVQLNCEILTQKFLPPKIVLAKTILTIKFLTPKILIPQNFLAQFFYPLPIIFSPQNFCLT